MWYATYGSSSLPPARPGDLFRAHYHCTPSNDISSTSSPAWPGRGTTVTLCVWSDQGPVVMFKQDALSHSALDIRPGLTLPPPGSAAGCVFVGCLNPSVTAAVLARHGAGDPPAQADEVRRLRPDFARCGYASQDFSRGMNGYRALATPIWDDADELRYGLVTRAPLVEFAGARGATFAAISPAVRMRHPGDPTVNGRAGRRGEPSRTIPPSMAIASTPRTA